MKIKKFSTIECKGNNTKYLIYKMKNDNTFEALCFNSKSRMNNEPIIVKIKKLTNGKYGIMNLNDKKQIITDEIIVYFPTKNEFQTIISHINKYSEIKPLPSWVKEIKYDENFKQLFTNTENLEQQLNIYLRHIL